MHSSLFELPAPVMALHNMSLCCSDNLLTLSYATLYRDYYKFHYGLTNNLLSLAVLIVSTDPQKFFPTRGSSVSNMAEFKLAEKYFRLLPIPVPILLIGLLPEN